MKKLDNYNKIIKVFEELKKDFPNLELGSHISTAFSEYGDLWGLSDKEFLFALEKYRTQLELDSNNIASDEYVSQIMKDAENLENILKEEDEEDGY